MSLYRRAKLVTHSFCKTTPTYGSSALESNPSSLNRFGVGRRYYNAENQGWFQRLWSSIEKYEETVPYTKRTRYVLFPTTMDKELGDFLSKCAKEDVYSSNILPETHPQCVRARLILQDIIQALHKGVKKESGSKSQPGDVLATTEHLDGLNWDILIVDQPDNVNAASLPGGKIILFTGVLEHCITDTEIATIIGHEVGHIIARHWAEQFTKKMCNPFIKVHNLIQLAFFSYLVRRPDVVNRILHLLEELPLFQDKHEAEADYIGLILVASAHTFL